MHICIVYFGGILSNYAVYTFNISDSTITRTLYDPDDVVISSQITSQQIEDFDITLNEDDPQTPYLTIDIIAIPDARITNNDIHQTIYLRLPFEGEPVNT